MDSPNKSSQTELPQHGTGSHKNGSSNGRPGLRFDQDSGQGGSIGAAGTNLITMKQGTGVTAAEVPPSRAELWLRRLTLALFVVVCVEVGMVLVVIPWTHAWTDNSLLISNLTLRSLALQNFVRGLVSGLGFINVWMGIWEAVHYREPKGAK